MKNAKYKIQQRVSHGGCYWYEIYVKTPRLFGLFHTWSHLVNEEVTLERAEAWVMNEKTKDYAKKEEKTWYL